MSLYQCIIEPLHRAAPAGMHLPSAAIITAVLPACAGAFLHPTEAHLGQLQQREVADMHGRGAATQGVENV